MTRVKGSRNEFLCNFGLSIPKLAQFMAGLGCKHAGNLDGEGSSTMVFKGKVANNAIGEVDEFLGIRVVCPISDAILIREKDKEAENSFKVLSTITLEKGIKVCLSI